jgi:cytochrome c-type biogenesis protein CcmH/NrfG
VVLRAVGAGSPELAAATLCSLRASCKWLRTEVDAAGEAWADLAMARMDAGEEDQASEALARALHLEGTASPAEPRQIYMLGLAMMKRSRLGEALASFEYTVKKSPDHGGAWLNLGAMQQNGSEDRVSSPNLKAKLF